MTDTVVQLQKDLIELAIKAEFGKVPTHFDVIDSFNAILTAAYGDDQAQELIGEAGDWLFDRMTAEKAEGEGLG